MILQQHQLPSDITVVTIVKKFKDDNGNINNKIFSVRKIKVLNTLYWLSKYSKVFKEGCIQIDPSRLDWMGDDIERELPLKTQIIEIDREETEVKKDNGPSYDQVEKVLQQEDYSEEVYGSFTNGTNNKEHSVETKTINCLLQNAYNNSDQNGIEWPYVCEDAVSEYGAHDLFPKAFPWLFPGGTGDFLEHRNTDIDASEWARMLLFYEDGRFAKDKMWCFYTLNYIQRRRNQSRGGFFVNNFSNEKEKSIEEIVEEIKKGKSSWIEKITYFSSNIKGSSGYWRQRRNEVYSWISHHVNQNHGAPNFFITLSCAEYWWPDIKRLIQDRFNVAGFPAPDLEKCSNVQIINEYTLIVQEYFQQRVKIWFETVGSIIFKIKPV